MNGQWSMHVEKCMHVMCVYHCNKDMARSASGSIDFNEFSTCYCCWLALMELEVELEIFLFFSLYYLVMPSGQHTSTLFMHSHSDDLFIRNEHNVIMLHMQLM